MSKVSANQINSNAWKAHYNIVLDLVQFGTKWERTVSFCFVIKLKTTFNHGIFIFGRMYAFLVICSFKI